MTRTTKVALVPLTLLLAVALKYLPDRSAPPPITPIAPGTIEGPYFSETDRVADRIIAAINRTRSTLDIAIFDLTHGEIAAAIADAHARGVKVRVVVDQRESAGKNSETSFLRKRGVPLRLSRGFSGGIMHNKFAVFDRRSAFTGSFNWTTGANEHNYENAIFLADPAVARRYQEEFEKLWTTAR